MDTIAFFHTLCSGIGFTNCNLTKHPSWKVTILLHCICEDAIPCRTNMLYRPYYSRLANSSSKREIDKRISEGKLDKTLMHQVDTLI